MSLNQGAGDRFAPDTSRSGDPESTFHLIERARAGDQHALGKPTPDAARKTPHRALVGLAEEMNRAAG